MNKSTKVKMKLKMKRCKYCFATENLTIDHKLPKALGGSDEIKNLQCLCARCNTMKSMLAHGEVQRLFTWFAIVNNERIKRGKRQWADNKIKKLDEA